MPNKIINKIKNLNHIKYPLIVTEISDSYIEARGTSTTVGQVFENIESKTKYEVVKSNENKCLLMPLKGETKLITGDRIYPSENELKLPKKKEELLGRVIDAFGNPIDDLGVFTKKEIYKNNTTKVDAMKRKRVKEKITTGVKSIDGLLTLGRGQRIGLFAGSGVGKTTLMGMIAKSSSEDINVIALIGERGREVREFIEKDLGEEGLKRSVVIVSTSDENPLMQVKATELATKISTYFREDGRNVLLMMDSLTRYLLARRSIDISNGEIPVMGGRTVSMEPSAQRLIEKAGNDENGSITAIYTVLVEGSDMEGPVPDIARGILDGHIVLTRELAEKGHFPAIDVLSSVSRVIDDIESEERLLTIKKTKKLMSIYKENEDKISLGMIEKGLNKEIDESIDKIEKVNNFLIQGINEIYTREETEHLLKETIN